MIIWTQTTLAFILLILSLVQLFEEMDKEVQNKWIIIFLSIVTTIAYIFFIFNLTRILHYEYLMK